MSFIEKTKAVVTKYAVGELIVDLGSMTIDEHGRDLSLSIRQFPGKPPHLSFKFYSNGGYEWFAMDCTTASADQLERAVQEMRKHMA